MLSILGYRLKSARQLGLRHAERACYFAKVWKKCTSSSWPICKAGTAGIWNARRVSGPAILWGLALALFAVGLRLVLVKA
jgi:hypothetical protein